MTSIIIDTSALSLTLMSLLETASVIDGGSGGVKLDLPPGAYRLQQNGAQVHFTVSESGVAVDAASAAVASSNGTTLTVTGVQVTIDHTQVSTVLHLNVVGIGAIVLAAQQVSKLTLLPDTFTVGVPHSCMTDLILTVTEQGALLINPGQDNYAELVDDSHLVLRGFDVTVDATELTHRLLFLGLPDENWIGDEPCSAALLPGGPYGFQAGSGVVASLQWFVNGDGTVRVDPDDAGYASAMGETLTVHGYDVTWDARDLAHDVGSQFPPKTGAPDLRMAAGTTTTFRMVPCPSLGLMVSSLWPDLNIELRRDGTLYFDQDHDSFLAGRGDSTVQFLGHPVVIDTRHSGVEFLGLPEIAVSATTPHYFTGAVLPWASRCTIHTTGGGFATAFRVRRDGTLDMVGPNDGLEMSTTPRVRVLPS